MVDCMDGIDATNCTDDSHCYGGDEPDVVKAGPIVRDVIFLIIGIIGNFCLLTIIFKKMHSVPNYLIANLTVVDTGFLLMYISGQIVGNLGADRKNFAFIRSDLACKVFEYFKLVFMGVSILTLTALSVDRYLAVSKPLAFRSVRSGRQRLCAVISGIAIIWMGAFAVSSPNLIMAEHMNSTYDCYVYAFHDNFALYVYSSAALYLVAPTCIIVFSYCCMARSLLKRNDLLASGAGNSRASSRQRHQRVRLAVAVIIIVIVFVATWSTYYITELLRHKEVHVYRECCCFKLHTWFNVLHDMATILLRINPVINPIILFTVSSSHRYYARQIFCWCLPDKSKKHKYGKSIPMTTNSTGESRFHKNSETQKTRREMQVYHCL
ncbi:gastrin-releasing peptide receptor-like isoform X1 [Asterias amurensis]|uniref:gastrin-releasing peptide receptor-like isoform X1 n=1 Tax=Asterias amurensis TaxID=7602 RepID=UPI003AB5EE98